MKKFRVTFCDEFEAESEEGVERQLREYIESLNDTIGHIPIDISDFEFEEVLPEVTPSRGATTGVPLVPTAATDALTESVLEDISNEYLDDE
jgi:hypothetical protein